MVAGFSVTFCSEYKLLVQSKQRKRIGFGDEEQTELYQQNSYKESLRQGNGQGVDQGTATGSMGQSSCFLCTHRRYDQLDRRPFIG